ncbi:MAG: alpha/beta fold hydrolase [Nitrospirae bacterium]|nr:alpha/beta fold hydrolase [Nitrospirota bacterium]
MSGPAGVTASLFERVRLHAEDFLYLVEDFTWILLLGPMEDVLARNGAPPSNRVGRPIVAVHGFGQTRHVFHKMRRYLATRGRDLRLFNYFTPQSVKSTAARLDRFIDEVLRDSGADKVDLVGHSLGGLVVRYYVQGLRRSDKVGTCVTLGAPHYGTRLSPYVPLLTSMVEMNRILRPNRFCRDLNSTPKPAGVRFINFYSPHDFFVRSRDRGSWPDADKDIRTEFVGHLGLIMDYRFFDILLRELRSTETHGVVIPMPERIG